MNGILFRMAFCWAVVGRLAARAEGEPAGGALADPTQAVIPVLRDLRLVRLMLSKTENPQCQSLY